MIQATQHPLLSNYALKRYQHLLLIQMAVVHMVLNYTSRLGYLEGYHAVWGFVTLMYFRHSFFFVFSIKEFLCFHCFDCVRDIK